MSTLPLTQFPGLAPNIEADAGYAVTAEGVDLSGKVLRGFPQAEFEVAGHSEEFTYFDSAWVSGGTNYLNTRIDGADALIFKGDGEWKATINGSTGPLWVAKPAAPALEYAPMPFPALPAAVTFTGRIEAGTVEYFTRYLTVASGVVTEMSQMSPMIQIVQGSAFSVRFRRPLLPAGYGMTHIELYRRRGGLDTANLVVRQSVDDVYLNDNLLDSELGEPAIVDFTAGREYKFTYIVAWVRNLGGWETESAPSALASISAKVPGVKLTRPDTPPDRVTAWRIYRISTAYDTTASFQLVAEVDVDTLTYEDRTLNVDLGAALASQYTSETGAAVAAGVPVNQFDGMAGPVNGYYIAWYGDELYLSEPGNPSWWPGAYVHTVNDTVVGIDYSGGNVNVVTESGVQVGYGTTPASFVVNPAMSGSGGISRNTVIDGFYLAKNGIYQMTEAGAELISGLFPASYFASIVTEASAADFDLVLRSVDDKLILFHADGALCLDARSEAWVEFPTNYVWDYAMVYADELYGRKDGLIYKVFGGTTKALWTYKTGRITAGPPMQKFFEAVRLEGAGSVYVKLIVDGSTVTTATMDLDSSYLQDRYIYPPNYVEANGMSVEIMALDEDSLVRMIAFDIHDAETEER